MKTLLMILTVLNAMTLDTHATNYNPTEIDLGGHLYHINEDYSISYEYKPNLIELKNGATIQINEDYSISYNR